MNTLYRKSGTATPKAARVVKTMFSRLALLALVAFPILTILPTASHADAYLGEPSNQVGYQATRAFKFYYTFAPQGWRFWSQQDATTWTERYDTGQITYFTIVGDTFVDGDHGIVVRRSDGGLEVFIPDQGSQTMWARWRTPGGAWNYLGQMYMY